MRKGFLVVIIAGLALGVCCYWYLTAHGFSAREQPSAVETLLARNARRLATPPEARNMSNPVSQNPENIAEARSHFADHCAICHGNRGNGKTRINAGLYPPAPDLTHPETQNLTDGEIFYIVKNGVRFTGMPGWGGDDAENWKLVLFIRHLSRLTDQELKAMQEVNRLDENGQSGHHH
jgi:mono/diheme cytochrome c family protein